MEGVWFRKAEVLDSALRAIQTAGWRKAALARVSPISSRTRDFSSGKRSLTVAERASPSSKDSPQMDSRYDLGQHPNSSEESSSKPAGER